jgi:hypothetical protein
MYGYFIISTCKFGKSRTIRMGVQYARRFQIFNNFTAFRQMKKHHSAISTLLYPKQTNVKGTPINGN